MEVGIDLLSFARDPKFHAPVNHVYHRNSARGVCVADSVRSAFGMSEQFECIARARPLQNASLCGS